MTAPPEHFFLASCRREPVATTPVWFMRQAGRALPEYRRVRGDEGLLASLMRPDLAVEVTLQPVRRYGVDAAIVFSDIVVPPAATGFGVDIKAGVGPVVEKPFRSTADLERVRPFDVEADAPWLIETVRILARELTIPLIGFAGAPFTVASYLIEGRPSRDYVQTKTLMLADTALWFALLDRLADQAIASAEAQIAAGAQAVQLFDSWAGALDPATYRRFVLPATTKVLAALASSGVPLIYFGVGTGELIGMIPGAGATVVGVDWRVPLSVARERTGGSVALQGNLDPAFCVAGWEAAAPAALRILHEARESGVDGHIFNLGHGVMPETDPDVLARIVDLVHSFESSR